MKTKLMLIIIPLIFICVAALGISLYSYMQYQSIAKNPQAFINKEQESVMKKLSEFMSLPDEKPTIVTVADKDKLQDQEFFKKAENGDMVVVFEKARRVILYRPSTGKVVDFAPLVVNQDAVLQNTMPSTMLKSKSDAMLKLNTQQATESAEKPAASSSANPQPFEL